ncbi:superoxide dismutase, partial [Syncephalis pseudoplumigaleata]
VRFTTSSKGTEVRGGIKTAGMAAGEYAYHIHEKPVPASGDCMATGGHFDPHGKKGATCTKSSLDRCEVGDLSGKFGKLKVTGKERNQEVRFVHKDPTIEFRNGPTGILGRSIVVHNAAGDRIACGNI